MFGLVMEARVKQGSLENVEVAKLIFEACYMTQILTETDTETLSKCCWSMRQKLGNTF